jgi:ABC-type transport system substrate-binding protein
MRSTPTVRGPLPTEQLSRFAALLCALLISACSNNPYPAAFRDTRDDGSPWQVRYMAMPEDPRSLDPQVSYDNVSRRVLEPLQECLLEYHPFKTDPYQLSPCLLKSMPERLEREGGGVTYKCTLKEGILFQDDPCFPNGAGRELVAGDVQFAFHRIADPKVECPALSNLQDYVLGMEQAFEAAKKTGAYDYGKALEGLVVTGRHTFEIHLKAPYPQLLYWLAMHFTSPVAKEAVEYYDGKIHDGKPRDLFRFHPVATGPFKLQEWKRNSSIKLVRNSGYRTTVFPSEGWSPEQTALVAPLAGHPLPLVDEIHMTIFREAVPIFLLFRQGYLDGMGVGKDAFSSLMTPSRDLSDKYKSRGITLHRDTEPSTYYMSLNMEDPVLGPNRKLRQALSAAFNSQAYLDTFYNSVPIVAQQLLPPGIAGHQKDFKNPYGYNLERAKALLAEAGYPNGRDASGKQLEITLDTTANGADERLMAEFEQRQFEQIGIHLKIVENTFSRLLEKLDNGGFQIAAGSGWGADYPDPENFFFLYYSKNLPPAGKNASRYKNGDFDRLFEKMATMENGPEREEIALKLNSILSEDAPAILLMHKSLFALTHEWAPRIQSNPMLEGGLKYGVLKDDLRRKNRAAWNAKPFWPVGVLVALILAAAAGLRLNRKP